MYRLYSFINCYLSSIQQGIQTAHLVSEILTNPRNDSSNYIDIWARNHKTIIVCNGGNNKSLMEIYDLFQERNNIFPWVTFYEDMESLDSILTGIGIILPDDIYDSTFDYVNKVWVTKSGLIYVSDTYQYRLIDMIKHVKLSI